MIKKLCILFPLILMMSFSIVPVFATDAYTAPSGFEEVAGAPNVSVAQVETYVDDKGGDIIGMLQYVGQPILITLFILCALLASIGALGDASLIGKGILGMIICGISYALVMYAPEMVQFIAEWAKP